MLLPHVLQLRRDAERAETVVQPYGERMLGNVVLSLLIESIPGVLVGLGVGLEDKVLELRRIVERGVRTVRRFRQVLAPGHPQDAGANRGPIADEDVSLVRLRVRAGRDLARRHRNKVHVEASRLGLFRHALKNRAAVGVDRPTGSVWKLDLEALAVLHSDAIGVLLAPACLVKEFRGLVRIVFVPVRRLLTVAGRRLADRSVAVVGNNTLSDGVDKGLAVEGIDESLAHLLVDERPLPRC